MFESYWALTGRIGELVDQTAYVHFMRMLNKQPQKPVMCILKNTKVVNQAFLPYLMDNFNIISDPEEVSYIRKIVPYLPSLLFFTNIPTLSMVITVLFLDLFTKS